MRLIKELKYLIRSIKKFDRQMLVMIVLFSILSSIFPFIWVLIPAKVLEAMELGNFANITQWIIIGSLSAIILTYFISYIQGNYRMRMNNVRYNLIREVMKYSLNMPFEYTLNRDEIEKISKARESVASPFRGAGGAILNLLKIFGLLLSVLGFYGIFAIFSPLISIAIFITLLINILLQKKRIQVDKAYWESRSSISNKIENLQYEFTNSISKQDIVIYNFMDLWKKYYTGLINDLRNLVKEFGDKYSGLTLVRVSANLLKDIIIFSWLVSGYLKGDLLISDFYLIMTSAISFMLISEELIKTVADLISNLHQFESFIEIKESNFEDHKEDEKKDIINQDGPWTIEFRNVSFKYPNSETYALKDINLRINDKERIALVGENGSGKSTLVNLLCRLYELREGEILLNGKNIQDYSIKDYREYISVIFQDASVLPFTIKENVVFSDESNSEKLEAVYTKSKLDQVIDHYQNGDSQALLRILDDSGVDLSGGQLQKLFLARCLYKEKAKMLILDEPTAALDPLAEKEFYESFGEIAKGKTTIFISHRLASTKFCDRIIYLSNGEIIEDGSHSYLMSKGGAYKDLFQIQARYYKEGSDE